jgi:hypothetical protein
VLWVSPPEPCFGSQWDLGTSRPTSWWWEQSAACLLKNIPLEGPEGACFPIQRNKGPGRLELHPRANREAVCDWTRPQGTGILPACQRSSPSTTGACHGRVRRELNEATCEAKPSRGQVASPWQTKTVLHGCWCMGVKEERVD